MKKYIMMAIVPFICINTVLAKDRFSDLDAIIASELRAAQKTINKNLKLELKPILHELVLWGNKNETRTIAIGLIVRIQKALRICKSEQYNPAWYDVCGLFSSKPEMVTKQIEPALKEVDKALQSLKVNQFEMRAAFKAVGLAVVGIAIVTAGFATRYKLIHNAHIASSGNISLQDQYRKDLEHIGNAALAQERADRNPGKVLLKGAPVKYPGQFDQDVRLKDENTLHKDDNLQQPLVPRSVYDSLGSYNTREREDASWDDALPLLAQAGNAEPKSIDIYAGLIRNGGFF